MLMMTLCVLDGDTPQGRPFPLAQLEMRFVAGCHPSCNHDPHPSARPSFSL